MRCTALAPVTLFAALLVPMAARAAALPKDGGEPAKAYRACLDTIAKKDKAAIIASCFAKDDAWLKKTNLDYFTPETFAVEVRQLRRDFRIVGLVIEGGKVKGVQTTRGTIGAGQVMQAVAGMTSVVAKMAGFKLPIRTIPLQACVSQPLKPFLDPIIVSGSLHIYVSQTARGELVMGGATDPYPLYSSRSTLEFKEGLMSHMLELFPFLAEVKVMRQWAGIADMTPDFSPVMGSTPLENYFIDAGWGTWGFKATPVCGKRLAQTIASGKVPELIQPFALDRFANFVQIGERGAASVGH
jgi:sarcosine oxidase subunit beta